MAKTQQDYRTEVADELLALLQQKALPWVKPMPASGTVAVLPFNPATAGGRAFRGMNALWLQARMMKEGWEDPRFVTFDQADANGWRIVKKSEGTRVQFWQLTEEREQVNEKGEAVKVKIPLDKPRSRIFTVFNAAQVTGMPPLSLPAQEWSPAEMVQAALAKSGVAIVHDQADRAFYDAQEDRIHLPPASSFADSNRYHATALRELARATAHPQRLDRKSTEPSQEDLRADLASFMLAFKLGIPYEPGAATVSQWVKALQTDKNEVFRAAADAETISNHIMDLGRQGLQEKINAQPAATARRLPAKEKTQDAKTHQIERVSASGKTDDEGIYRSKISFRLDAKPAQLELTEMKGQPQPVSHSIKISAGGKRAEGILYHNGSVSFDDPADFTDTTLISPARNHELSLFKHVAEQVLQMRDGQKASIIVDVVKNADKGPKTFAEALAGLRDVQTSAELQSYCTTIDERFLNRQLVMDDKDWPVFNQAVAGKTAQLEQGNVQPNEGKAVATPAAKKPPGKKASSAAETELGRTFLAVPFDEIKRAKALGARWDKDQKVWYLPPGKDVGPLKQWVVDNSTLIAAGINPADVLIAFENEMRNYGLIVKESPRDDGEWHYVPTETSRGNAKNGAYVLNMDGIPHGYIKNFKSKLEGPWRYDGVQLTPEQKAVLEAQSREQALLRNREVAMQQSQIADACESAFYKLNTNGAHDYMARKEVGAYGVRFASGKDVDMGKLLNLENFRRSDDDWFIIPGQDVTGKIWTLQAISSNKNTPKLFVRDAKKKGAFHLIGADNMTELSQAVAVLFAEGYATAASLHEATRLPVVVGFDSGNLAEVAKAVSRELPAEMPKLFCADNDQFFVDKVIQRLVEVAGRNPNDSNTVAVASSLNSTRAVSLQGLIADGEWHESALGRYKLELEKKQSGSNKDVVVEVRAEMQKRGEDGAYQQGARFSSHNTGLRAAAEAASLVGGKITAPNFASIDGQPTDFNDLAVREGHQRVQQLVGQALGLSFAPKQSVQPQNLPAQTTGRREVVRAR